MKKLLVTTSLIGSLFFAGQAHADSTYIVRSGDTLSGIAKTYQITVDSILDTNNLSSTNIFVGQNLTIPSDIKVPMTQPVNANDLIKSGEKYLGAAYLFGANETRTDVFDCSSFTKRVFLEHGIILPRVSSDQANAGQVIPLSEAKPGDLLFYDTNSDGRINHVGIYVAPNQMLHASTSKGVAYSNTQTYWNARFVKAVRVLLPQPNTQYAITAANNIQDGPFTDISNLWNKDQVLYLHELGIIKGSGDRFMPSMEIPRSQLVVMLFRALELNKQPYDGRFGDVSSIDWYAEELMAITTAGIAGGTSPETFNPNGSVTRAQAAKMIHHSLLVKGFDSSKLDKNKSVTQLTDYQSIPDWSIESINFLLQADIISGKSDGSYNPNGKLTRAEMAKLLYKMLEIMN